MLRVSDTQPIEPSAFHKYSICWVFQAFFCSTFLHVFCNSTKTNANSSDRVIIIPTEIIQLNHKPYSLKGQQIVPSVPSQSVSLKVQSESLKIQSVSIKIPNQNLYIVGIVTFSQKLVTDIGDSGDLQKS